MRLYLRLCAAILAAGALTAAADDQPWTLEASNWEKGKDLLPEPVVKRLQKGEYWFRVVSADPEDRKSTRLNSSHGYISYAVFCLKKKNTIQPSTPNAHSAL